MENLTTQDSLKIIQTVINQRKRKYEENGKFLLFWGILIMAAGITQFIMIKMGYRNLSGLAWLCTMLPGFIFTWITKYKEDKKAIQNHQDVDSLGKLWGFAGIIAMMTGFLLGSRFGMGFTAVIFLPFCVVAMASALNLKNRLWILLTLLATVILFGSLYVPFMYHPLIASFVAFLLFLLPGLQFYLNHKKRQNV